MKLDVWSVTPGKPIFGETERLLTVDQVTGEWWISVTVKEHRVKTIKNIARGYNCDAKHDGERLVLVGSKWKIVRSK